MCFSQNSRKLRDKEAISFYFHLRVNDWALFIVTIFIKNDMLLQNFVSSSFNAGLFNHSSETILIPWWN